MNNRRLKELGVVDSTEDLMKALDEKNAKVEELEKIIEEKEKIIENLEKELKKVEREKDKVNSELREANRKLIDKLIGEIGEEPKEKKRDGWKKYVNNNKEYLFSTNSMPMSIPRSKKY